MTRFVVQERRDIVPKRPGRYRSFPGLVRTAGGLLVAYRDARAAPNTFSHGADGDLALIRFEAGRWSEPEVLYRHEGSVEEMGCGDLTRMADGSILLFSRQYDAAAQRSIAIHLARSTDDGRTFAPRRRVEVGQFPNGWVPYGKVIETPSGEWLLGGYGRLSGDEGYSAACVASLDRGESWDVLAWIAGPEDADDPVVRRRGFPEPFIWRLPDGRLFSLLRTNGLFYATGSEDGGRAWGRPVPAFKGMASAGIVLSSGEVLVTYRGIHEEVRPPAVRPPTVAQRKGRLYCCRVSDDGGRTWSPELAVDDGEAWQAGSYGMGDCVELDDGTVLVIYYTSDRDQAPWIQQCVLAPA